MLKLEKGISLLELLITMTILALIILPITQSLIKTSIFSVETKHYTIAMNLARGERKDITLGTYDSRGIDQLKKLGFSSLREFIDEEGSNGSYTFNTTTFNIDGFNFSRTSTINYVVWLDTSSQILDSTTPTDLIKIKTIIQWSGQGGTKSISLTTLSANWEE